MRRIIRLSKLGASSVALAALTGCAMPRHQDAVFFGTDTKVAFDVGVQPENGNTPSLTLGYKRREFVYMPLAEYGPAPQLGVIEAVLAGDFIRDGKASDDPLAPSTSTYDQSGASIETKPGVDADGNPIGNRHKYVGEADDQKKDSYSVFATFGGNFNGGTEGGGANIKQVFATGIAAQIASTRGEEFVSNAAAEASKQKAVADAKKAELEAKRLEAAYSPAAFSKREELKLKIDQLSDEQAIALSKEIAAKNLVDTSDIVTSCFNLQNCPEFQPGDGAKARNFLRRAIESQSSTGNPDRLQSWESALN